MVAWIWRVSSDSGGPSIPGPAVPRRPAGANHFGADRRRRTRLAPDGRSFITAVGLTQSSVWVHDGGGDRQSRWKVTPSSPNSPPMGSGCSTTCEKALRSNCGWRNSIPDAASLFCRALPLHGQGPVSWKLRHFPDGRQVVVASPDGAGKLRCGSRRSTARRPGKFPTSKVDSPCSARLVKSFSAASRDLRVPLPCPERRRPAAESLRRVYCCPIGRIPRP